MFLREYIDRIFAELSKVPKKRDRIHDTVTYDKEQSSPFQAPKWTLSGYNGSLKVAAQNVRQKKQFQLKIPLYLHLLRNKERASRRASRRASLKDPYWL